MKSFPLVQPEIDLWNKALSPLGLYDEPDEFEGHFYVKDIYGVEIGCLYGDSANVILRANPRIKLISLDPFIPDSMEPSLVGDRDISLEKNKEFIGSRWRLIDAYSYDVVKDAFLWEESLDFVFIDGDHSYEGCLRDYNDWVPKIKRGGLLFMHDSRMGREGSPNFHEGPSMVARSLVYGQPDKWKIIEEAFSLTCACKI